MFGLPALLLTGPCGQTAGGVACAKALKWSTTAPSPCISYSKCVPPRTPAMLFCTYIWGALGDVRLACSIFWTVLKRAHLPTTKSLCGFVGHLNSCLQNWERHRSRDRGQHASGKVNPF
eukprot:366254-Chlamydomonas_euryale.AAC.6